MEIQIREKCSTCGGKGLLDNPLFEQWVNQYRAWATAHPNEKGASGYGDSMPPCIIRCGACNSDGYIYSWVEPAELSRLLQLAVAPGQG